MTVVVTPNGTRGTAPPRFPGPLMAVMGRLWTGMFRRFGARMRIAGRPLLLLTTVGAKSGEERQSILGYWEDETRTDGSLIVCASLGGSSRHPAWMYNLARHPDQVWIEREGHRTRVTPESLTGEERKAAWQRTAGLNPQYAGYQRKTDREIPLVRLTPAA